jgi:hypothetical protein
MFTVKMWFIRPSLYTAHIQYKAMNLFWSIIEFVTLDGLLFQ